MEAEPAGLNPGLGRPHQHRRLAWRPSQPALSPALPAQRPARQGFLSDDDMGIFDDLLADFLVRDIFN